jgi:hypothetical protein
MQDELINEIDLLNELKANRKLIWLLINALGGEIHVLRSDEINFDEHKCRVEKYTDSYVTVYYSKRIKGGQTMGGKPNPGTKRDKRLKENKREKREKKEKKQK